MRISIVKPVVMKTTLRPMGAATPIGRVKFLIIQNCPVPKITTVGRLVARFFENAQILDGPMGGATTALHISLIFIFN